MSIIVLSYRSWWPLEIVGKPPGLQGDPWSHCFRNLGNRVSCKFKQREQNVIATDSQVSSYFLQPMIG